VMGGPLLDAARRELDQRSRLAHLRVGADRAESAVTIDLVALGSEAPLVGAAAAAREAGRNRAADAEPGAGAPAGRTYDRAR
jgi:hypothetical protein